MPLQVDGPEVLAFYLPQFHPIPENDLAWGRGFVEWTNVVRARPLYEGHYQPHMPGELGFYDLRVPEVREQQAELARAHGITGFCYYHYWFSGRRPLGRPFDEVLRSGKPDFPFCLAWANENWSTRWDGGDEQVFIKQEYSDADHEKHIEYLIRAWSDPRYIRLDDRPVFFIYRAYDIPGLQAVLKGWREKAIKAGVGDPYFVKFDTRENEGDPSALGCDAAAEFLPHGVRRVVNLEDRGDYRAFDYREVAELYSNRESVEWVRFPCVVTGWDNTPRHMDGLPLLFNGSSPELYESWLKNAVRRAADEGPDDGLVLISAWNEWAEGAHLEPDEQFGRAYLEATSRAVGRGAGVTESQAENPEPTTFAQLHADLYERYTALQRVHAGFLATQERRMQEVDELRHQEVSQALKDAAELAQWAEKLRADIELMEEAIELAEGGAATD